MAAAGGPDRALRRLAAPDKLGRYRATKQQKPQGRFWKTSIRKRIDRISERILQHGSVPGMATGRVYRNRDHSVPAVAALPPWERRSLALRFS